MRQPSCAICGAPLPTVPADSAHPERCPACAARAVGVTGPTSDIPPPPPGFNAPPRSVADLVVKTRWLDAVLVGVAFAALGGLAWWGAAAALGQAAPYLAVLVGIFAGQGVLVGARRGGPVQAALALVFTLGGLLVAQYFVARSTYLTDHPLRYLPLWDGLSVAKDLVKDMLTDQKVALVAWAAALVIAVVTTIVPSRRSPLG